jgi:hypothetical protein
LSILRKRQKGKVGTGVCYYEKAGKVGNLLQSARFAAIGVLNVASVQVFSFNWAKFHQFLT